MSQVRMSSEERVAALQRFGYSKREAEFLCLAALHGGYFLRRQYGQFLQQPLGGVAAALIEKALTNEHVRVGTYASNTYLYHLAARPFYTALGQPDNRNRRPRQPTTIKSKLMGFDFVLSHPEHHYLATEQEKVDYFSSHSIDPTALPSKRFCSNGRVTDRYFVEKYPLFLTNSAGTPPVVSFCFIDEGLAGISGFQTFLAQYAGLLGALSAFHVIYVAASGFLFQEAQRAFDRFRHDILNAAVPDPLRLERMRAHFELRCLYELQQWEAFDRAKLIRLRDERQEFSGSHWDVLYAQWRGGGEAAVESWLARNKREAGPADRMFSTCLLKQNYDIFGRLANHV